MRRVVFFAIAFVLVQYSYTQNGWEFIKQDDHVRAKQAFLKTLEHDSTDVAAIQGLIYLCDVEDNDLEYNKYADKLLIHHFNNHYFQVFERASSMTSSEILEKEGLDVKFKVRYQLGRALQYKRDKEFTKYRELCASTINDFEWAYLGPFKNINGYGHEKPFSVELEKFEKDKIYLNRDKYSLNWVIPEYNHPIKTLDFDDFLMKDKHGSTYYANTFFEMDSDKDVFFAVSREYPIKIWLDDQLIFQSNEFVNYRWETEKIKLKIEEGNHRLLVKYSISNYFTGISKTYNNSIEEYGYDESSHSSSRSNDADNFRPFYSSELAIRISDLNGVTIPLKTSSHTNQEYETKRYKPTLIDKETVNYFMSEIEKDSSDWFNYYMLSNAYFDYGLTSEIEEFFVNELKTKKSTFFKFIMFQLYNINGKKEKGFVVLNGIDHDKTPVFSVLKKELSELDAKNQPVEYENALKKLLEVTPSNRFAIRSMIDFLDEQGRVNDRINFAKKVSEEIKEYEEWLEQYVEEDFKPNDYYIGKKETKKNPKKEFKEAKQAVQEEFTSYNYDALIKKYKAREKEDKVLELYDEYLAVNDWSTSKRKDKAKYLFNLERYDEALQELTVVVKMSPYDGSVYELIGDIYNDQGNDSLALEQYKKAELYAAKSTSYYGGNSLEEKITKIEGQKGLKNEFVRYEFDDWLKDDSWKMKYQSEESVILGFTADVYMDEAGKVEKYSKMLIQILTEAGATSWTEYNFGRIGSIQYIKVIKPNGVELFPDMNGSFVVFKNLEPGDKILFETEDSYVPKNELGSYLHGFQDMIFHAPLNFAKLEVVIPEDQELNYLLHKLDDNLVRSTKNGFKHYLWEYNNLPKQVAEEALVDVYDTYTHIQYNTLKDWASVVEWYQAKTYRKLEMNYELRNILDTIIADGMSDKEKVIAVYNFITKKITYSHTRLLQSGYIPKNTELTCSGRIGDCKDVATLMVSMLNSLGIESYYVLVKTNNMFHQQSLPSLYFDHVIAGVDLDGTTEYYDLTTDFYPYYVTNENDMNAWALKIKEGNSSVFRLPNDFLNKEKNLVRHVVSAQVNLDKSVDIKVESQFHGMRGGRIREVYHNKPRADMENEILDMLGKGVFKNVVLKDYKFLNPKEITGPFEAEYALKVKKHADNVLDIYFLTIPYLIGIETNTAILTEKRQNTLNLHGLTKIEPSIQEVKVLFPEGMKLYKLPKNIHLESKWGVYDVKFKEITGGVKVVKFQQFFVDQVPVDAFADFKKFYLDLLEYDKTKIVFNGK